MTRVMSAADWNLKGGIEGPVVYQNPWISVKMILALGLQWRRVRDSSNTPCRTQLILDLGGAGLKKKKARSGRPLLALSISHDGS